MAQRVLFRTKADAYAAAKRSGEPFYTSKCVCDRLSQIADAKLASEGCTGETGCFRGPNGAIYAWWEE